VKKILGEGKRSEGSARRLSPTGSDSSAGESLAKKHGGGVKTQIVVLSSRLPSLDSDGKDHTSTSSG